MAGGLFCVLISLCCCSWFRRGTTLLIIIKNVCAFYYPPDSSDCPPRSTTVRALPLYNVHSTELVALLFRLFGEFYSRSPLFLISLPFCSSGIVIVLLIIMFCANRVAGSDSGFAGSSCTRFPCALPLHRNGIG